MKVICDRGALVEALNLVGAAVVSRTPKPVLTCVKLSATEGSLVLAATDLEVAVRTTTVRVEVQEAGEALIPAEKFGQIVRESVDPTLTLETDEDSTHIRGQDAHFKIMGYPVGDFPPLPEFTGAADFELPAEELGTLVHQTIYATARENSRYAINGVLLEREGNKLSVVATDGHRLALAKGECQAGIGGGDNPRTSAIVPTKALTMLLRLLSDAGGSAAPADAKAGKGGPKSGGTVKVKIADNQILFATETALLASNLVEGNFPPYKDVIPRDGDKKATMQVATFVSGVRRAALLTNEESKGIRLSFTKSGLTLSSRAAEMGEAEVKVDLPAYDGEAIDIGFNPQYVLDALKVMSTEQVTLDMRAPNKPGVLRTGPNFLYVIMPVNLQ
jgi:DNA polymerase III subunit beta